MNARVVTVGLLAIVILIMGIVWIYWDRPDPQVEKVKQLQAAAFDQEASPEQRRERFEAMRREIEQLSHEQRNEVRQSMREQFEQRMDAQINEYFSLPQQQRVAYLDNQIKEMEQRRREFEARRNQAGPPSGPGGPFGPPGAPQAGPGGPPGQRDNSPEARATRRVARLDNSTPEQRAKRAAYFADLQKRRAELGLPPMMRGRR